MANFNFRSGGLDLLPEVVKNLLIINGLFFLATYVAGTRFGIDLNQILGLHFPGSTDFKPYQIITYMFMHGNLPHLIMNMFAQQMFQQTSVSTGRVMKMTLQPIMTLRVVLSQKLEPVDKLAT